MVQIHGGNLKELAKIAGCKPDEITDFSVSINPLGIPESLRIRMMSLFEGVASYPDPSAAELVEVLAEKLKLPPEMILCGNGANQLIHAIPAALKPERVVITVPAYGDYERACADLKILEIESREENDFIPDIAEIEKSLMPGDLVFIGNPGNPAGTVLAPEYLRKLACKCHDVVFVIDEAFIDFVPEMSLIPEIPSNVIVLRSITKFYSVPGLRLGYCVASSNLIQKITGKIPVWSLNSPAIKAGKIILTNDEDFCRQTFFTIKNLREKLKTQLQSIGIKVFSGQANYLLLKASDELSCLDEILLKKYRIAIRNCENYAGLDKGFFRIGLRLEEENDRLFSAVAEIIKGKIPETPGIIKKKRTPSLMLQGTSSDAGKSILTAAFCRIMLQDGFDIAPFKAQNMSLNSYVTPDGGEIGRAQALQAEACRLDPDVRMNPVLLKPCTDTGSQVVLLGKPETNMKAREYHTAKMRFFDHVKNAYDSLASEHDAIVLEGAGSPAEINLKDSDIVNMNMARYAESPVLLVGDIDRGGVYASFLGTYATFDMQERKLLKGFLVNKFRGDSSLLAFAHKYIFDATGKPVFGVIPYVRDLRLPEEDSASFNTVSETPKHDDALDVALICLPHIANFTDFTPLESEPDLKVRHVRYASDLGKPDVIILPGSKNTIGDLAELRSSGFEDKIMEVHRAGVWIIGICGGLQMAGTRVEDPHGIESSTGGIDGMNILPLITVMGKEKCLCRTTCEWKEKHWTVSGYEIHHGSTTSRNEKIVSMSDNGRLLGFASGRVWLSYLHGVFDSDRFRRDFIDMIRIDLCMNPLKEIQSVYNVEPELNRLADVVRKSVDMDVIYRMMGLK